MFSYCSMHLHVECSFKRKNKEGRVFSWVQHLVIFYLWGHCNARPAEPPFLAVLTLSCYKAMYRWCPFLMTYGVQVYILPLTNLWANYRKLLQRQLSCLGSDNRPSRWGVVPSSRSMSQGEGRGTNSEGPEDGTSAPRIAPSGQLFGDTSMCLKVNELTHWKESPSRSRKLLSFSWGTVAVCVLLYCGVKDNGLV